MPLPGDIRQRPEQQAELAEAGIAADQFCKGAKRPTPAGQMRIQPGVARGERALRVTELAAFPQLRGGVQ